jgi:hypothetical protein
MSWNSEENESEEKNQEKSGVLSVENECKRSTEADESKVLKSTGRGKGLLQK